MVFDGKIDRFNGITTNLENNNIDDVEKFYTELKESIVNWKKNNLRVSWFKIPLNQSKIIPHLADEGYIYHHAKPNYVMMYKWLSENEPNNVPSYAYTNIGVGGLVIDDQDRVLVVKEKHFFATQMWKFPGGYAEQGEEFYETAEREVFEETGIKCKFQSIIALRHYHKFAFDCSDLYIVCHLKPIVDENENKKLEIKKCDFEVDDCQWIPINELKHQLNSFNCFVINKYLENRENNIKIDIDTVNTKIRNFEFVQTVYSIHNNNNSD